MKEVKQMFDFEDYATAGMIFLGYDITNEDDLARAYENHEPWVCESYGEYFVDYEKAYYILRERGIF